MASQQNTIVKSSKAFICKKNELKDEEARAFEVDDIRFLLVRRGDTFLAVGNKCTHYAAPLGKGVYCNGRVRCPWHGAVFSVETGDIEDYPGLDSLPTFQISVDGDNVNLVAPGSEEKANLKEAGNVRTRPMHKKTDDDPEKAVVIVGGGAAAVACAETLRQEGHNGGLLIVSDEPYLPYDRPKLSKQMDADPDKIQLRSADFYAKHDIELKLNSRVVSMDTYNKRIKTESGEEIAFGKLVLATGGNARQMNKPGMEASAVISKGSKSATIHVVGTSSVPFENALGADLGAAIMQLHESHGIKFHMKNGVREIVGSNGRVSGVVLEDGTRLKADLVISGIGCKPNTDFVRDSNVTVDDRGYIHVDDCMKTNVDDIYAAGDICTFPLHCFDLDQVNIQHWQMAKKHGRTAALSIVGKPKPIQSVPFFWSMMFGKGLRYAGYRPGCDDMHVNGDLEALKFAAYYFKDNQLRAVATIGADPTAAQVAELLLAKQIITKQQVQTNTSNDWSAFLL